MSATPIYDAIVRERVGREAREFVRKAWTACPTCKAHVGAPCTTTQGQPARRPHKARRLP